MIEPPHPALTMWLALDEADVENGCLRYEAGSATADGGVVRPHCASGVMGFSQVLERYNAVDRPGGTGVDTEVAVPAAPGDLILHHARMAHRADANTSSTRHRRALGAIFYGASAKVDQVAYDRRQAEIHRRAAQLPGQVS